MRKFLTMFGTIEVQLVAFVLLISWAVGVLLPLLLSSFALTRFVVSPNLPHDGAGFVDHWQESQRPMNSTW